MPLAFKSRRHVAAESLLLRRRRHHFLSRWCGLLGRRRGGSRSRLHRLFLRLDIGCRGIWSGGLLRFDRLRAWIGCSGLHVRINALLPILLTRKLLGAWDLLILGSVDGILLTQK
jgi:hypothetical protein